MSESVTIYVNERPVTVRLGTSLIGAVRSVDADLAADLERGAATATDGVGRPVAAETVPTVGAIFRVIRSARGAGAPKPS